MWLTKLAWLVMLGSALFFVGLPPRTHDGLSAHVRLVGRFQIGNDWITSEWPGSLMEIRFTGAQLSVTIQDSGNNDFMVEINGEPERLRTRMGTHVYAIVDEKVPSNYVVRLIRTTEASFGRTTLRSIQTDGELLPPRVDRTKVLSIGDSISTGYGVEGPSTRCTLGPEFQNQYQTFAAVAARNLDADIVTLAISGVGLVRNYDGNTRRVMARLVRRLLPSIPIMAPSPIADVVVIHLGTNDFLGGARPEQFSEVYEDLLKEIRTTSPDAMIYAAIGPMLSLDDQDAAMAEIQSAVSARLLQGERQVRTLRFSSQPDTGCDGHPGMITHSQMAEILEKKIREDMKWPTGH